jgi:hypothetical protein
VSCCAFRGESCFCPIALRVSCRIQAGEVSGTSISIAAGGPVRIRRLVGGDMRLEAGCGGGAAAATAGLELGAVYGKKLLVRTGTARMSRGDARSAAGEAVR